jgi:surface protein
MKFRLFIYSILFVFLVVNVVNAEQCVYYYDYDSNYIQISNTPINDLFDLSYGTGIFSSNISAITLHGPNILEESFYLFNIEGEYAIYSPEFGNSRSGSTNEYLGQTIIASQIDALLEQDGYFFYTIKDENDFLYVYNPTMTQYPYSKISTERVFGSNLEIHAMSFHDNKYFLADNTAQEIYVYDTLTNTLSNINYNNFPETINEIGTMFTHNFHLIINAKNTAGELVPYYLTKEDEIKKIYEAYCGAVNTNTQMCTSITYVSKTLNEILPFTSGEIKASTLNEERFCLADNNGFGCVNFDWSFTLDPTSISSLGMSDLTNTNDNYVTAAHGSGFDALIVTDTKNKTYYKKTNPSSSLPTGSYDLEILTFNENYYFGYHYPPQIDATASFYINSNTEFILIANNKLKILSSLDLTNPLEIPYTDLPFNQIDAITNIGNYIYLVTPCPPNNNQEYYPNPIPTNKKLNELLTLDPFIFIDTFDNILNYDWNEDGIINTEDKTDFINKYDINNDNTFDALDKWYYLQDYLANFSFIIKELYTDNSLSNFLDCKPTDKYCQNIAFRLCNLVRFRYGSSLGYNTDPIKYCASESNPILSNTNLITFGNDKGFIYNDCNECTGPVCNADNSATTPCTLNTNTGCFEQGTEIDCDNGCNPTTGQCNNVIIPPTCGANQYIAKTNLYNDQDPHDGLSGEEINCNLDDEPAKTYYNSRGMCGDETGITYWNNQGQDDFNNFYTAVCDSYNEESNQEYCNDVLLCDIGDDYQENSACCNYTTPTTCTAQKTAAWYSENGFTDTECESKAGQCIGEYQTFIKTGCSADKKYKFTTCENTNGLITTSGECCVEPPPKGIPLPGRTAYVCNDQIMFFTDAPGFSVGQVIPITNPIYNDFQETPNYNIVFATQETYSLDNFGSISDADQICQDLAEGKAPGTYKAWISSSTESVNERFYHSTLAYKLPSGTKIADNYYNIINGQIENDINQNISAEEISYNYFWSGTNYDGTSNESNCLEWSSNAEYEDGFGTSKEKTNWNSGIGISTECSQGNLGLLCIEQIESEDNIPTNNYIFRTSTTYKPVDDFSSIYEADNICQEKAENSNLKGNFIAWISDSNIPFESRIIHSNKKYILPSGTLIANNYTDLTDKSIENDINENALGENTANPNIFWAGTNYNGTAHILNCNDWTSNDADEDARAIDPIKNNWGTTKVTLKCDGSNNQGELLCISNNLEEDNCIMSLIGNQNLEGTTNCNEIITFQGQDSLSISLSNPISNFTIYQNPYYSTHITLEELVNLNAFSKNILNISVPQEMSEFTTISSANNFKLIKNEFTIYTGQCAIFEFTDVTKQVVLIPNETSYTTELKDYDSCGDDCICPIINNEGDSCPIDNTEKYYLCKAYDTYGDYCGFEEGCGISPSTINGCTDVKCNEDPFNSQCYTGTTQLNGDCLLSDYMLLKYYLPSDDITVTLPLNGDVDVNINWGDNGENGCDTTATEEVSCIYSTSGEYNITIIGIVEHFGSNSNINIPNSNQYLIEIINWTEELGLKSLEGAFANTKNLILPNWIPSTITNTKKMFYNSSLYQNLNSWDVSNVTDMNYMFFNADFTGNIDSWNTEKVNNMEGMFGKTKNFNQNLNSWNVTNVNNMNWMFYNSEDFNGNISLWDVTNVENMISMFNGAFNFNQNISNWNVENVNNMSYMFYNAYNFNQDISAWDVSKVNNMEGMFGKTKNFNQNLNSWNVTNVNNMNWMFYNSEDFNGNISLWDVTNVENMEAMFSGAFNFNQNISNWNVENVNNMSYMFYNAYNFNQNISGWDVNNVKNMKGMFQDATNFNQNLSNWCVINIPEEPTNFNLGAGLQDKTELQPIWGTCPTNIVDMILKYDITIQNTVIELPLNGYVNVEIDWGDNDENGCIKTATGPVDCEFSDTGIYTITISGEVEHYGTDGASSIEGNKYLQEIINWGDLKIKSLEKAFINTENLIVPNWIPSTVNNLDFTFSMTPNSNPNVSNWDVSNVTSMQEMFDNAEIFDQPLGNWNTSNVENMDFMFRNANNFNQDISSWCVEKISSPPTQFDDGAGFMGQNDLQPNWGEPCVSFSICDLTGLGAVLPCILIS